MATFQSYQWKTIQVNPSSRFVTKLELPIKDMQDSDLVISSSRTVSPRPNPFHDTPGKTPIKGSRFAEKVESNFDEKFSFGDVEKNSYSGLMISMRSHSPIQSSPIQTLAPNRLEKFGLHNANLCSGELVSETFRHIPLSPSPNSSPQNISIAKKRVWSEIDFKGPAPEVSRTQNSQRTALTPPPSSSKHFSQTDQISVTSWHTEELGSSLAKTVSSAWIEPQSTNSGLVSTADPKTQASLPYSVVIGQNPPGDSQGIPIPLNNAPFVKNRRNQTRRTLTDAPIDDVRVEASSLNQIKKISLDLQNLLQDKFTITRTQNEISSNSEPNERPSENVPTECSFVNPQKLLLTHIDVPEPKEVIPLSVNNCSSYLSQISFPKIPNLESENDIEKGSPVEIQVGFVNWEPSQKVSPIPRTSMDESPSTPLYRYDSMNFNPGNIDINISTLNLASQKENLISPLFEKPKTVKTFEIKFSEVTNSVYNSQSHENPMKASILQTIFLESIGNARRRSSKTSVVDSKHPFSSRL